MTVLGRIWYYIDRGQEPARRVKRKEPATDLCWQVMQNNDGPNGRIKGKAVVAAKYNEGLSPTGIT